LRRFIIIKKFLNYLKSWKKASFSATLKIPIIMYHYVDYIKDVEDLIKKRLYINPDLFEGQLKALKEASYKTYFVREIPDILEGKIEYSIRLAVLTFDDG
jgi:peptidoglycan/xylan/chitin deacetylase (PgdA/CDA1 family)